ncbi:MAG: zinc-dependent peptidase [Bacteroidales bacterium]|nr:zinc-dependent peptidase [Bacteroidales bacterium]
MDLTKSNRVGEFLSHNWFMYPFLTREQQAVVLEFIHGFCARTEFFFSPEVEPGEEFAWLVGANAALVGAAQRTNHFASVRWVYLIGDDDLPELSGDALGQSTVRINAWDLVEESQRRIPGQQIAVHEFAHILDEQFGITDSTPALRDALDLHLRHRREGIDDIVSDHVLPTIIEEDSNQEFFAYMAEYFFTDPHQVKAFHPGLYRYLADLFGLDLIGQLPPYSEALTPEHLRSCGGATPE